MSGDGRWMEIAAAAADIAGGLWFSLDSNRSLGPHWIARFIIFGLMDFKRLGKGLNYGFYCYYEYCFIFANTIQ